MALRHVPLALLALLSLPGSASAAFPAGAECPTTCATVSSEGSTQSCWAEGTHTWQTTPSLFGGASVQQDLPASTIHAHVAANLFPCRFQILVCDEFELHDAPIGSEIPIRIRLPFHYTLTSASLHLSLSSPGAGLRDWDLSVSTIEGFSETSLTIPVVANFPFALQTELTLVANTGILGSTHPASGDLEASWTFEDLPAGASIVSCRGYAQSTVPTQATTWARVRAAYR